MFQTKVAEKIKTNILYSVTFFLLCHLWDIVEKYCSRAGHKWQCGECALHTGYLRLQTHTHRVC